MNDKTSISAGDLSLKEALTKQPLFHLRSAVRTYSEIYRVSSSNLDGHVGSTSIFYSGSSALFIFQARWCPLIDRCLWRTVSSHRTSASSQHKYIRKHSPQTQTNHHDARTTSIHNDRVLIGQIPTNPRWSLLSIAHVKVLKLLMKFFTLFSVRLYNPWRDFST